MLCVNSLRKKKPSPSQQEELSRLEEKAERQGICIHYERLEAAGLKLKEGMCILKGECHLFVDKRKSTAQRIAALRDFLTSLPAEGPDPSDV